MRFPRVFFIVIGLLVLGMAAYVLFVLSDPVDAFKNAGPFTGRVVDAETKKPVKGALVGAAWAGSVFIHGGGCAGHTMTYTDGDGRFYIPWQGMNIMWFLHDGVTPGGMTVWAVDHQPWSISKDLPRTAAGTRASLPIGVPFQVKDIGTIELTPMHGRPETDEDRGHLGLCEVSDKFELSRAYQIDRFAWNRACGVNTEAESTASEQLLELAQKWKNFTVVGPYKPSPAMVEQLGAAYRNYDSIDLILHDHARLKVASELTEDDRRHVCEMLDIRMPELEDHSP